MNARIVPINHIYTADSEHRSLSLAELVDELVDGWTTREVVTQPAPKRGAHENSCAWPGDWHSTQRIHVVHHPALLNQLAPGTTSSSPQEDAIQQIPGPRAGARLDALAVAQRIERESAWWLRRIGWPAAAVMRRRLRTLVDAEAATWDVLDHRDRHLVAAVSAWRTAARIVTGWDTVPWSPNVPCPVLRCEKRQSVRVRLETRAATCVECGETWDGDRFLQLGHYVAWATVHLSGPRHLVSDDATIGVAQRPCPDCAAERAAMTARRSARTAEAAMAAHPAAA